MLLDVVKKMSQPKSIDVLIVGSGPGGISTALHLVQADPKWATRMIVLEKAVHPREKLCGGGVTQLGESVLFHLGLPFEPSHIAIREMRIVCQQRIFAVHDEPVFRIVRRNEFDYWLVNHAEQQGVVIRQEEKAKNIVLHEDYAEVFTDNTTFHAKIVVAADGSNSIVCQKLKLNKKTRKARTLEVLTPESEQSIAFEKGIVEYDFTSVFTGLQGYYWNFPCLISGKPFMSRGIFDSRIRPERQRIDLKKEFEQTLSKYEQHIEDYQLKGFPIQWFDPDGIFAKPRVLLVGDAAGVDPLFGEGISFALAYGEVAATEIVNAYNQRNFSFSHYKEHLLEHPILRQLHGRAKMARFAYNLPNTPLSGWLWNMTPLIFQMLAWYKPHYVPVRQPHMTKISDRV